MISDFEGTLVCRPLVLVGMKWVLKLNKKELQETRCGCAPQVPSEYPILTASYNLKGVLFISKRA